ncbi:aldehyde dehydrogenase family protein [Cognatishimia sp. F0-27]|uniref:aldehyde dehydrogenase family protein n=1 Tax=Cognatishimia sp. F0-27 TaxID=2816855 RepID=UPI001D0C6BB9|nr:aldehyde dehydrogenase family protein [Cognatishimia sp. F0-27]MCC1491326.1 aldehyde dehydrogenase family protein [Cognatishimia sp. F0-27]
MHEAIGGQSSACRAADEAANSAARAFWSWSKTTRAERVDLLRSMADILEQERPTLVEIAALEVGAAPQWTDFNIAVAKKILLQACDLVPLLDDQTVDHPDGRRSIVRRQAVGVVLGFVPWNAPVALAARAMAAPVACGNSVVLKASEHCPRTHQLIVDLFTRAGLPKDVVTVVTNGPDESFDVARALIRHPTIRRINFTGSTRVGQMVAIEAAQVLKRCLLELSGKAPLIVLDDADLDLAAAAAMTGAFFNQGQVCMSTERIIVLDAVADAFVDKLVSKTRALHAADPRDETAPLGRLVNEEAARRVSGLIDDAVALGATLRMGGEVSGAVMQPAVLDHITPNMRIYLEESFGPVASVIRVRDVEEAISVANDTEFGLASAVFSRDPDRCAAVADRLETGICQINGPTVFDDPTMPFGGMKSSGYGRFGGTAALDEFTEIRWLSQHNDLQANDVEELLNLGRKEA